MCSKLKWIGILTLVFALTFGLVGQALAADNNESTGSQRMIVMFENGVNDAAKDALFKKFGGESLKSLPLINGRVVMLPPQAAASIANSQGVLYVEPDDIAVAAEQTISWGVDRIDADLVNANNKGTGVKVAVIDTGVDYTHPDLAGNFDPNLLGYDFIDGDTDPMDEHYHGHGTHVAGIIAANDNDTGVVGVAPEVSLYAVRVLSSSGSGYYSDIVSGIEWSVDNGIQVANMSLGGLAHSNSLRLACNKAYDAGVLLVAAAGNDGTDTITYPAVYDSVIAVSATDISDSKAFFSSYGDQVELTAPGVSINSTLPGGEYGTMSGTSMATPHVTGTAALVIASGITGSSAVRDQLDNTAEDLGAIGRDQYYGFGLVDAEAAAFSLVARGTISGTVSSAGEPIADAIVTAGGYSSTTAADGTYTMDLPAGTWSVTASAIGYVDDSQTAVVEQDTITTGVDFILATQPAGSIAGIVTNEAGSPIADANVIAGEYCSTTADDGSYILTDLPAGTYTVTASATDFDDITEAGVEVLQNQTTTVDFTLTASPLGNENDMYVRSINFSKKQAGKNTFLLINVNIARDSNSNGSLDESDLAVAGADIELTLYNLDKKASWTFSGVTDSNGQLQFSLKKAPEGSYMAKVSSLTHNTYTWNYSLDTESTTYSM